MPTSDGLVAWTVAPGRMAPDASLTLPAILPVRSWAVAEATTKSVKSPSARPRTFMTIPLHPTRTVRASGIPDQIAKTKSGVVAADGTKAGTNGQEIRQGDASIIRAPEEPWRVAF